MLNVRVKWLVFYATFCSFIMFTRTSFWNISSTPGHKQQLHILKSKCENQCPNNARNILNTLIDSILI